VALHQICYQKKLATVTMMDEGVDGKIFHYLTSESIMSSRVLGAGWTVTKILDCAPMPRSIALTFDLLVSNS
jgi:hypothetical protein